MAVAKPLADITRSGWYQILPPAAPPRPLTDSLRADWIIVGAGFAGLTAAHRLAARVPEDTIVVLEAQPVGWGAAGRSSGFMIDLPHRLQSDDYAGDHDVREIRHNRFAIDYARAMVAEFGLMPFTSDAGRINAAADTAGCRALDTYTRHLTALGESFTRLDAEALKGITGTAYYHQGLHLPGCLLLQPAGYIRGLAAGLADRVRLFDHSPVTEIRTGDRHRVYTDKGMVEAKNVILTVNGQVQAFGYAADRLMHFSLYAGMTRELDARELARLGGQAEWGITPAHPMGSTVRRLRENRILIRNHITYNPHLRHSERQLARARFRHQRAFRRRFPMLDRVEMEYRWSGVLCLSRNAVPLFGEVERGVYVACCQNGLGAAKGTLHGILIADHALGDNHPMVREVLAQAAPKPLLPMPLMRLGVGAVLWWGQCRAGRDV